MNTLLQYLARVALSPYCTVKKWAAEVRHVKMTAKGDPWSAKPSKFKSQENVDKIHKTVLYVRRLKVKEKPRTRQTTNDSIPRNTGQ